MILFSVYWLWCSPTLLTIVIENKTANLALCLQLSTIMLKKKKKTSQVRYLFCFDWTHNQHDTCRRLLCKFWMFGGAVHLWMDEGFKSAVNDDSHVVLESTVSLDNWNLNCSICILSWRLICTVTWREWSCKMWLCRWGQTQSDPSSPSRCV